MRGGVNVWGEWVTECWLDETYSAAGLSSSNSSLKIATHEEVKNASKGPFGFFTQTPFHTRLPPTVKACGGAAQFAHTLYVCRRNSF
jgi:hypothetical protein